MCTIVKFVHSQKFSQVSSFLDFPHSRKNVPVEVDIVRWKCEVPESINECLVAKPGPSRLPKRQTM